MNQTEVKITATDDKVYHLDLRFYINGEKHVIRNPDPSVLLVNYLRSTKVGLTGTKHACGQGGCGSCTVLLSKWDEAHGVVANASVNSCLRPLVALDGMEVTTVEGLGTVDTEVSPVQYAIAKNNGSQCGYCTPGFVMNMHSLLLDHEGKELTKKEIEQAFDGNICRCTGFRPILYGMKTFATDWAPKDAAGTPACCVDASEEVTTYKTLRKVNEKHLDKHPRRLHYKANGVEWYRPLQLHEVNDIIDKYKDGVTIKLVCGNTSIGIPAVNPVDPAVMIDISHVAELRTIEVEKNQLTVGAATTYSEFLNLLKQQIRKADAGQLKGLNALNYMATRTAGRIVRNVASLAGNTMLVARNVKNGSPFPSDLFVALSCLDTQVSVSANNKIVKMLLPEFVFRYNDEDEFSKHAIILAYHIPFTRDKDFVQTYKVAARLENSHSLANAGFKVSINEQQKVTSAILIMGGITTHPVKAVETEKFLIGKDFSAVTLTAALPVLTAELKNLIDNNPKWFKQLPTEGITDSYRISLLQGYFYKFFIEVLGQTNPGNIPAEDESATKVTFDRPVSKGQQNYSSYPGEFPVNMPYIKLSAFEQATGEAIYTHDIPVPVKGLQGAFVTSTCASGTFSYQFPNGDGTYEPILVDTLLGRLQDKFDGLVAYYTDKDIPGTNGLTSYTYAPDPIFAMGNVSYYGQCIGLIVAEDEQTVLNVAAYITNNCIKYSPSEPVLTLADSIAKQMMFPDYTQQTDDNQTITKPGSDLSWALKTGTAGLVEPGFKYGNTTLNGQNCLVVAGTQLTGDQKHFYMETQSCFSTQGEQRQMVVNSSSQSPDSVQGTLAQTLAISENNIDVEIVRLGGGYGGKTTRTPYVAAPATLASYLLRRPVRIAMPREIDSYMVGNRHPFWGEYNVAIVAEGQNKGKIMGTIYEFYSDGGSTKDCSFDVMDCAVLGADGVYSVANFQTSGYVYKTNKSSNTAMRSYGGIQCSLITEESIEAAAHKIGMLPEDVRGLNLYSEGQKTPYGQSLYYCILKDVWKRIKKISDFEERQRKVQAFNKQNKWKKRGISMIPLKYGLGYNLGFLMQGGAHIDIYVSDGSVLVSHGGIEMGQGIMTKVAQIAAYNLNVPLALIRMDEMRTSTVPDAIGTGATSGSDLNGGAVMEACKQQRAKLEAMCLQLLQTNGSAWCIAHGINYWDYKEGWQAMVTTTGGGGPQTNMIWINVLSQAYQNRVDLSTQVLYSTPGLVDGQDQQFYGFTYSAACSEVEIDVLTGEFNILRSDVLYDIDQSLNPAIDIGQVEGAFVMGIGNMTSEKLVWEPAGTPNPAGMLNTPNTWTYKPPCAASIPLDLRVDFFPRSDAPEVPPNPNLVMSSKGIGEPPLVLSNTVFFAIKHAVLAARQDRGYTDWFAMDAPATVENIKQSCMVEPKDLIL